MQEEDQNLKNLLEESDVKYTEMNQAIGEVDQSIEQLMRSKDTLMDRYRYLSGSINVNDSNMVGKQKSKKGEQGKMDEMGDTGTFEANQLLEMGSNPQGNNRKSIQQMLMDMDNTCTKEKVDKFKKHISDILNFLQLNDDGTNLVDTLMKIEERLNFLCEARNFLNAKDKRLGHLRTQEKDIETFEKDLARERMDKIVREK